MVNLFVGVVLLASFCHTALGDVKTVFGDNVVYGVTQRVPFLLSKVSYFELSVTISCGNTTLRKQYVADSEVAQLGEDGFLVRYFVQQDGSTLLVSDGKGRGPAYGCYEVLEQLGFAFLHPLSPVVPKSILCTQCKNITESPYWPVRGWHIHTEHPLELTDFLQGFDIVVNKTVVEPWGSMMGDWLSFLDWAVANKISQVEYVLLSGEDWHEFALSDLRKSRFRQITQAGQNMSILIGADSAIAITQQHDFALINSTKDPIGSIHWHLDWLLTGCGFDFLSTESGFSEFTHPDDTTMLAWMNETTRYSESLGKKSYIKCHCSTGQTCPHYKDPRTGQPLNFNYLPIYADTRLGIMPHTVQFYAFDDPAPTYGNANFSDMFDFMFDFMGTRETIFHPETAYWVSAWMVLSADITQVNYDIDVPLFLPIYGLSRVRDLRYIAQEEKRRGTRVAGQNVFDSGWEWGYWLQDIVTSRAVWDPCMECEDDIDAFRTILARCLRVFGSGAAGLTTAISNLAEVQRETLIEGRVNNGTAPAVIAKHNAQAYLEGWDTWSDLGTLSSHFLDTQPSHLSLLEMRIPAHAEEYWRTVSPLLAFTNTSFWNALVEINAVETLVPDVALPFFNELVEATHVLALRTSTVYALYDYASAWTILNHSHTPAWREGRLQIAREAILAAVAAVAKREEAYRVPLDRVAGWRAGPTAYGYGYLWTVHSLFYWFRDYAIATLTPAEALSPCFRNIENPIDVAFGEGIFLNATEVLWEWIEANKPKWDFVADCLNAPTNEPHYSL